MRIIHDNHTFKDCISLFKLVIANEIPGRLFKIEKRSNQDKNIRKTAKYHHESPLPRSEGVEENIGKKQAIKFSNGNTEIQE